MNITFGKQIFTLHPSGALIWPKHSMLIVADLHLEKSSHFARRGYFLPPYDSHETLTRLLEALQETQCKNLMILGDCFHDPQGYARLREEDREIFNQLLDFNPLWITGNHDGEFVPKGFTAHEIYQADKLSFRHEALAGAKLEISAHYHPKIEISHKNDRISYRCFVEDGQKLLLPAFGAYTGGFWVTEPVFKALFPEKPNYYAVSDRKIVKLN